MLSPSCIGLHDNIATNTSTEEVAFHREMWSVHALGSDFHATLPRAVYSSK